jgi:hypothetical protein
VTITNAKLLMDENQYRQTYLEVNTAPCVFERAILRRCGTCPHAQRLNIAEREAVGCQSEKARPVCREFLDIMYSKSVFAIRPDQEHSPLPFGKEIKIQCGGLLGLQSALTESDQIQIYPLLKQAMAEYGQIEQLPFDQIVREVNAFKSRRKHKSV